jgi:hypothetical protein
MSAIAIPFDPWCVDYYRTMAATLAVCRAIRNGAWTISIAKNFWIVNRDFKALLTDLDRVTDAPVGDLRMTIPRLEELHKSINKTLDITAKSGLTNRTLINAPVHSLRAYNTRLLDVIERWKLSLDPSVSAATRQAIEEYERGETVSLDSLV